MHRIIIWLYLQIGFSFFSTAQQQKLLQLEQKYFSAKNDTLKSLIAIEKFNTLISNDSVITLRALNELDRVNESFLSEKQKLDYYWNFALLNLLDSNKNCEFCSSSYLLKYFELNPSVTFDFQTLIFINAIISSDTTLISQLKNPFKDVLYCLKLETKVSQAEIFKNRLAYLPGLGLITKGKIKKGLIAFAFNGASIYLLYHLIKNKLYLNAFGWGSQTLARVYLGQIKLTENERSNSIIKKDKINSKICYEKLLDILIENPLKFRKLAI